MKTLRSKFIFWISVLFVLMGTLIFAPLSVILPEKISSQILKRDIRIAQYLAREIQEPLLINNKLVLQLLLEDRLTNLDDAIYIFIKEPNGNIVLSTFKEGFPRGLLKFNPIAPPAGGINRANDRNKDIYSVMKFVANGEKAYDIATPLLEGELGELHLGVSLESSKTEITEFSGINYYVAAIIFAGLGVGILIFTFLGIFLSSRIIRLKDFAAKIGDGDLENRIELKTNDELGSLAVSFNEMASSLKEKIEKIKRLSYLEERNRIALEFHDGLAQDLANIIKRLELCERLFTKEPLKAYNELQSLQKNTRGILQNVREIIMDLKSHEERDFKLLNKLSNFLKDYEEQNQISVRLNISGATDAVSPQKAKQVYFIITEALTNVKKHSLAKNVRMELESSGNNLKINIQDDGKGFDVNKELFNASDLGKLGLLGMKQRAVSLRGAFAVESELDKGTKVSLSIPLN